MAGYISYHKIRLFDDPRWAKLLQDEFRNNARQLTLDTSSVDASLSTVSSASQHQACAMTGLPLLSTGTHKRAQG